MFVDYNRQITVHFQCGFKIMDLIKTTVEYYKNSI